MDVAAKLLYFKDLGNTHEGHSIDALFETSFLNVLTFHYSHWDMDKLSLIVKARCASQIILLIQNLTYIFVYYFQSKTCGRAELPCLVPSRRNVDVV